MIKLIKKLNKKEVILFLFLTILILLQVGLELKLPEYISEIISLIQTKGSKTTDILHPGVYMMLCTLGTLSLSVLSSYIVSYITSNFSKRLREEVFNKVIDFNMEEIKMFSVNSLITRTTNDISQIQMFLSIAMQMLIKSPILAVWAILKILNKNKSWSILIGGGTLAGLLYILMLVMIVMPKFKKVQEEIDNVNGITRETLSGIKVVRAFNANKYQENKFEKVNKNLTKIQTFTQKMMSTMWPFISLVMQNLNLGIYLIGAFLINNSALELKINLFGDMIVFSTYAGMILMSFISLAMLLGFYPRAAVSAGRITKVLDTKGKIKDGNIKTSKAKGEIEFKNVSFKYPDADECMLKDISFKIKAGETFAVIGSTGSGKSTLVNLIPRFYDLTSGEITIDGINIKDYKIEYLNQIVGYVPQKAGMFKGTIKENVLYGDTKETSVKKAIEVAQANDFVLNLEKKYNHEVARGGTNISGGQKQRLSIAGVIARNPKIYIFDDTFSALDYKTDATLRKELKKYTKESTNVIVSQRIGTIINADKILVIEKGKMVGIGTHKELLKTSKVYKEIAKSQLSEEELS